MFTVTKDSTKGRFTISDGVNSIDIGHGWGVVYDILKLSKSKFMLDSIKKQCHLLKEEFASRNELED